MKRERATTFDVHSYVTDLVFDLKVSLLSIQKKSVFADVLEKNTKEGLHVVLCGSEQKKIYS